MRASSQETVKVHIIDMSLNITYLRLQQSSTELEDHFHHYDQYKALYMIILFWCCYCNFAYSAAIRAAYDDVIDWKHFPRCWPFLRGIRRSPVDSSHKWSATRSFVFFDLRLDKRPGRKSKRRWSETPLCLLWRHFDERPRDHITKIFPLNFNFGGNFLLLSPTLGHPY